jgi:hypothetical protein
VAGSACGSNVLSIFLCAAILALRAKIAAQRKIERTLLPQAEPATGVNYHIRPQIKMRRNQWISGLLD